MTASVLDNAKIRKIFNDIPMDITNSSDIAVIGGIKREVLNLSRDAGEMLMRAAQSIGGKVDLNHPTFEQAIEYCTYNGNDKPHGNVIQAINKTTRKLQALKMKYTTTEGTIGDKYFDELQGVIDNRRDDVIGKLSTQEGVESLINIGIQKELVRNLVVDSNQQEVGSFKEELSDQIIISPTLQSMLLADPNQFKMLMNIVRTAADQHLMQSIDNGVRIIKPETLGEEYIKNFASAVNTKAEALLTIQESIKAFEEQGSKITSQMNTAITDKLLLVLPELAKNDENAILDQQTVMQANIIQVSGEQNTKTKANDTIQEIIDGLHKKSSKITPEMNQKITEQLLPILAKFDLEYIKANRNAITKELQQEISHKRSLTSYLPGVKFAISSKNLDKIAKRLAENHQQKNNKFIDEIIDKKVFSGALSDSYMRNKVEEFVKITNTPVEKDLQGKLLNINMVELRKVNPTVFDEIVLTPHSSLTSYKRTASLPSLSQVKPIPPKRTTSLESISFKDTAELDSIKTKLQDEKVANKDNSTRASDGIRKLNHPSPSKIEV